MRRALEPEFCVRVSRAIVSGKIMHQRKLLLRAQRQLRDADLAVILGRMRLLSEQTARAQDLDTLRGVEGMAAALYFGQFSKLLKNRDLAFSGRNRRPPRDPVNACLSFAYALLGTIAETEVLRSGLDPLVGFFHQPLEGRPSLMLDLLEEFRPMMDTLVLRLINRRQLGPLDFERRGGPELEEILAEDVDTASEPEREAPESEGVYLADTGRKVFLVEFYRRLRERLYYPPRQGAFELRDIIREQAYHLARVIQDEEPEYVPFVPA
jgi:CRISPR-associated protein Cas1